MSQPNKEKKKQFMLPSALRQLQQHKQAQTQQFIKELGQEQQPSKPKKQVRHTSLFKFNLESSAIISEVPVDSLRKRSKSQRLQSIQTEQRQAFSLLDHYRETQTKKIKEKPTTLKKYDIDLRQITGAEGPVGAERMDVEEQQEKYQIVRPSETYHNETKEDDSFFQPMIFQTPILPCFASQFQSRIDESKRIRQGEGAWRIGKMRIKGNKCQLRIGQFLFQGNRAPAEGKAGALSGSNLYMLPNWRELCILQPHESLFQ